MDYSYKPYLFAIPGLTVGSIFFFTILSGLDETQPSAGFVFLLAALPAAIALVLSVGVGLSLLYRRFFKPGRKKKR